jgi:hypothetical protein
LNDRDLDFKIDDPYNDSIIPAPVKNNAARQVNFKFGNDKVSYVTTNKEKFSPVAPISEKRS